MILFLFPRQNYFLYILLLQIFLNLEINLLTLVLNIITPLLIFIWGGSVLVNKMALPGWVMVLFIIIGILVMICATVSYLVQLIKRYDKGDDKDRYDRSEKDDDKDKHDGGDDSDRNIPF